MKLFDFRFLPVHEHHRTACHSSLGIDEHGPNSFRSTFIAIGTDAAGNITSWDAVIDLYNFNPVTTTTGNPSIGEISTNSDPHDSSFQTGIGSGYTNSSGTWTCTGDACSTPTPEPSSLILLGTGLLCLLALAARSKRHAPSRLPRTVSKRPGTSGASGGGAWHGTPEPSGSQGGRVPLHGHQAPRNDDGP